MILVAGYERASPCRRPAVFFLAFIWRGCIRLLRGHVRAGNSNLSDSPRCTNRGARAAGTVTSRGAWPSTRPPEDPLVVEGIAGHGRGGLLGLSTMRPRMGGLSSPPTATRPRTCAAPSSGSTRAATLTCRRCVGCARPSTEQATGPTTAGRRTRSSTFHGGAVGCPRSQPPRSEMQMAGEESR